MSILNLKAVAADIASGALKVPEGSVEQAVINQLEGVAIDRLRKVVNIPAFAGLTDAQIADILNHNVIPEAASLYHQVMALGRIGYHNNQVTAEDVAAARKV